MSPHELADLFPRIQGDELKRLVKSIRENGLREPITTYEGQILDGRNRFAACREVGVEPRFVEYKGDNPLAFVIDKNLHRRHLSESQRSMVAANMATLKDGQRSDRVGAQICAPTPTQDDAADMLNVSRRSVQSARSVQDSGVSELIEAVEQDTIPVSVAAKIAKESETDQREILAAEDPKTEIKRRERTQKLVSVEGKAAALPERKYAVIYADPPWNWEPYSEAGKDRTPENHYPLMTIDDICGLDAPAADDAVLFLWVTTPHLMSANSVIERWGFTYKSHIVWKKNRIGTGYWVRNMHETLLIATRGDIPAPNFGEQCNSVIEADVGAHSEKPEIFRTIIDGYYPGVEKLELFARRKSTEGWYCWGNEVENIVA